jgi:ankyrin repeat protein
MASLPPSGELSIRARAPKYLLPAVLEADAPFVEFLLSLDVDTERIDSEGFTPILIAAKKKKTEIVLLLLEKADVHARDRSGKTVLHHALFGIGGEEMIQAIVKNGADVNATDDKGRRPLHYCARYNKKTAAQILVSNHADLEAKDKEGKTAAMIAVERKDYDLIRLFHNNGATFNKDAIPRTLRSVKDLLDELDEAGELPVVTRQNSAHKWCSGIIPRRRKNLPLE